MKRMLSLFLAVMLAASAVVSCSESTVNTEEDAAVSADSTEPTVEEETEAEEEVRFLDGLPETMDFGGAEIRFLLEEGHGGPLTEQSIYVEEDTGDVVVSAVYNRNLAINERLNTAVIGQMAGSDSASNLLRASVTANSDDYDVIGVYQYYGAVIATTGMIFNLNSDRFPHFDFTREYWGTDYMNNLSYKGNTPWCTGDLALRYIGGIYATYVNKTIWNEHYPDANIYDLVDNGEWTLDKMLEVTSNVYIDTNGDGTRDNEDVYGYIQSWEDPIDGLSAASLVRFSELDEDGTPSITLANERTYTFYDKLYRLCYQNEGFHNVAGWEEALKLFAQSKAMMHVSHILESGLYFREMEDDFAIIPTPKLDETQEYYNTMIHDGVTLFGIPTTNVKCEATSALLEALSAESYHTVTPAYYDVALKTKYTRDSDAGRMMDIIREHVSSDFAGLYSEQCSNIIHFFRSSLSSGDEAIASKIEKNIKVWNKSLERLLTSLEENAETQ